MAGIDDLEERTRVALRRARLGSGRSLADVAAAAGMGESTLSRLETGARRLTLGAVDAVCQALGITPESLLRDAARQGLRIPTTPVRLAGGHRGLLLAHDADGSPWMRLLVPAAADGPPALASHPGHDWVHVLHGRLRLLLDEEVHVLAPGETVHFDTDRPHGMAGEGGQCEVLLRVAAGAHGPQVGEPGDPHPFDS